MRWTVTHVPTESASSSSLRDRVYLALSDTLPYAALLVLLAPLLAPASISPGTTTLVGLLIGGAYAVGAGLTSPTQLRGAALAAVCLSWLAALWFSAATLWATNPQVSLFGNTNVNNGAALWVMLASWLTASVLLSRTETMRRALAAVVCAGVTLSLTILYESAASGIRGTVDVAAGMLVSSISAAEVLAVGVVAAVAGVLSHRRFAVRAAYAASILAMVAGLLLAEARTGWLALGLALALAYAVFRVRSRRAPIALAVGIVASAVALTTLLALVAVGTFGDAAATSLDRATNYRSSIWAGAIAQLVESPAVGKGLAQFTFLQEWSVAEYGLASRGTFDPHNVLLAAAVGGGVVGLSLVIGLFATLLTAAAQGARRYRTSSGVALIAATPAVLLGSGMIAWLSPSATVGTVLLSGIIAGSALEQRSSAPESAGLTLRGVISPTVAGALAIGVVALAVGVAYVSPYRTTYEYAAAQDEGAERLSSSDYVRMYLTYPDPKIGGAALITRVRYEEPFSAEKIQAALQLTERDTVWAGNLAQEHLNAHVALLGPERREDFSANFDAAIGRATQADPLTGAWDTVAAMAADSVNLDREASTFAQLALDHHIPEEYIGLLEELAEKGEAAVP